MSDAAHRQRIWRKGEEGKDDAGGERGTLTATVTNRRISIWRKGEEGKDDAGGEGGTLTATATNRRISLSLD